MNYYSHTIRVTNFDISDVYRVKNIFKIGYLLSRNKLKDIIYDEDINISETTALFNGMDYISLCDLTMEHDEYSAYNMYTKRGLSLIFNKKLPVIKPSIVNMRIGDIIFGNDAHELGMGEKRYSDLADEVQVRDSISLDYMEGIILSLRSFYRHHNELYLIEYLNLLKEVINNSKYSVPIINLDSEKEIIIVIY
jgi:hypothetical protein